MRKQTIVQNDLVQNFKNSKDQFTVYKTACAMRAHSVVSDYLGPQGLGPDRLLCPWNFPGKNTAVGCHFLLQGKSDRRAYQSETRNRLKAQQRPSQAAQGSHAEQSYKS